MTKYENMVSIGIPAYNRANKIGRTIESLLAQTYQNFEIIISDDCSPDDTRGICEKYKNKDMRICYVRQPHNVGMTKNFKYVLDQARGDYFFWAGDDDWYHPNFISDLKNALDKNVDCGVAMSSVRFIKEDASFNDISFDKYGDVSKFSPNEIFKAVITKSPALHLFTTGLFRTEIARRFFPRLVCRGQDKIMVSEMSFSTRLCSISNVLQHKAVYEDMNQHDKHMKKSYSGRTMSKFVIALFTTLFTSNNLTLKQKILSLPLKIFFVVWVYKRNLLSENFPWSRRFKNFIFK